MDFKEWLSATIENSGMSYNKIAKLGGISHSRISQVVNGEGMPGEKFCVGIAKGLGLPPSEVLRRAGYMPLMDVGSSKDENELFYYFSNLDAQGKREAVALIKALKEARE